VAHRRTIHTSDSVFTTFPWQQCPTRGQIAEVAEVAEVAVALRALRREVRAAHGWSLRQLKLALAAKEKAGEPITPPDLPSAEAERSTFITDDCVRVAEPV